MTAPQTYESWLRELQALAAQSECDSLLSREPDAYRAAYEQGLTANQEFFQLQDMAQWRGCGCGGNQ